jgi:hypothetical protein
VGEKVKENAYGQNLNEPKFIVLLRRK